MAGEPLHGRALLSASAAAPGSTLLLAYGALVAAALAFELWRAARARALVEEWAREHRFRLTECRRTWFHHGPFTWTSSRYQIVFRIAAEDLRFGSPCRGWVRCGRWWTGRLTPESVDVRWTYIGEMTGKE